MRPLETHHKLAAFFIKGVFPAEYECYKKGKQLYLSLKDAKTWALTANTNAILISDFANRYVVGFWQSTKM